MPITEKKLKSETIRFPSKRAQFEWKPFRLEPKQNFKQNRRIPASTPNPPKLWADAGQ